MSLFRGKEARTDAKRDNSPSLRELLRETHVLIENYKREQFFCGAEVDKLMTRKAISDWKETHPLHRPSDIGVNKDDLVDRIAGDHRHRQLFAILVAAELECFAFAVLSEDQSGKVFPNIKYKSFSRSEQQRLDKSLQKLSPVFSESEHKDLAPVTVLPFIQRTDTGHRGSFGRIYRVEVADGHLESYKKKVVAMKLVYLDDISKKDAYLREADTLRKKKHANIVPLLASYSMKTTGSDSVPPLHFLFPFADGGNLHNWMNSCNPPGWLQDVPPEERDRKRRGYLYHAIYELVTGLSFLHREMDGKFTSHHDLKPKNILIFGKKLKIADFGRSHLRSIIQGSETEGKSGLGTYEYQPPEYRKKDGSRAKVKLGRSFDIYSMGCIILDLATLIAYGWESEKVTEFRRRRKENEIMPKTSPPDYEGNDASFHNNPNIVEEWIQRLERRDGSQKMHSTLKVALQMMDENPHKRLYAWEAELDLGDIQFPDDDRRMQEKRGEPLIPSPPPKRKIPRGTPTPLHRAAVSGNLTRFVQLYKKGWSLDDTDGEDLTPWKIMEKNPRERCNELRARLDPGHELLKAAAQGDLDMVQDLIEDGVDTLFVDEENRTALFIAVQNNRCPVAECLLRTTNGKKLLQIKDRRLQTPLHKAASMGHLAMIKFLLSFHPDLEIKEEHGETALFLAVEWDRLGVVDVLLEHGAQVFTQNVFGGTPLHAAAINGHSRIIEQLLVKAPDARECLEYKGSFGKSPLFLAVLHCKVDCALILLKNRASLHVVNDGGDNVIHIAVQKDLYDFLKETINQFKKEEFQSRNRWNETPLMIAQKEKKRRFVELLTPYTDRSEPRMLSFKRKRADKTFEQYVDRGREL